MKLRRPTSSRRTLFPAVLYLLVIAPQVAAVHAEVTQRVPAGFVSEHELVLAAQPAMVYGALTAQVHQWWDASHSYSGVAGNFSLDARAGGCFCEALENSGSVEHMRVVFADPGNRLRLQGGLGPLQELAVSGTMDFLLLPHPSGTLLRYRYRVSGSTLDGLENWAEAVDAVQLGQLLRLQRFVRTGKPD